MSTRVYLSTLGRPVPPEEATVSVFDRGFLYGDDVFETMRTARGRCVELERHLARLRNGCAAIGLELPWTTEDLARLTGETHAATDNDESYVRMMVTRGQGPLMLDPRHAAAPLLMIIAKPLALPTEEQYDCGIAATVVHVMRGSGLDPAIKSGNYLENIQTLRKAIAAGADDAIMCDERGHITEGPTSNVFIVQAGSVLTPPLDAGILPGITRQLVCEVALGMGLDMNARSITLEELRGADEIFMTSSVRGMMPVTRLSGQAVGTGREGPMTRRLRAAYDARILTETRD